MRCGAKCFLVEIEADGEKQISSVIARTPAEARKNFRTEYGAETPILSVREKKGMRPDRQTLRRGEDE